MNLAGENESLGDEFLVTRPVLVGKEKSQAVRKAARKESRKLGTRKRTRNSREGVVYLGHIPQGLEEDGIKKFMSQFGRVEQLRLARSLKTGKSKGYAFIQFEYAEVAKVVAETMNNYLVGEKLLKCELLPKSRVYPNMFESIKEKNINKRLKRQTRKHDQPKLEYELESKRLKVWKKIQAKKEILSELGIDLKEKDIFDAVEKKMVTGWEPDNVTDDDDVVEETGKKSAEKRKKAPVAKKATKSDAEVAEEQAVRYALDNEAHLKELMEQLRAASQTSFVISEDKADEVEEDVEFSDEDQEMTGSPSDEMRVYDSDSDIELKTPPGMRKRKITNRNSDEGFSDGKDDGKQGSKERAAQRPLVLAQSAKKTTSAAKKRAQKKSKARTKSAPVGISLAEKKVKPSAFLNRSLNKGKRTGFKEAE